MNKVWNKGTQHWKLSWYVSIYHKSKICSFNFPYHLNFFIYENSFDNKLEIYWKFYCKFVCLFLSMNTFSRCAEIHPQRCLMSRFIRGLRSSNIRPLYSADPANTDQIIIVFLVDIFTMFQPLYPQTFFWYLFFFLLSVTFRQF